MKRAAIALMFGLSAYAVQAQPPSATSEEANTAQDETTVITAEATTKPDTNCVRDTGTRLAKRDEKGCTGAPGDSYSREQIERTGATDTADAVRKLSPRATVRRGN